MDQRRSGEARTKADPGSFHFLLFTLPQLFEGFQRSFNIRMSDTYSPSTPDCRPEEPGSNRICHSSDRDAHPSHFQHLLESNEPPSECEAKRLRDTLLRDAEKRSSELDGQLLQISKDWEEVFEARIEVQKFIVTNRAILSPIRRLPSEIISEILSLAQTHESYEVMDVNELNGPWVLARICSRWRSVAHEYPPLWTAMSVTRFMRPLPKDPLSLLQTALGRTGNRGLNIQFSLMHHENLSLPIAEGLFDSLLQHVSHWEDVYCNIPIVLVRALAQAKDRLQLLSRLSLYIQDDPDYAPPPSPLSLDVFDNAPSLRIFSLRTAVAVQEIMALPWTLLTSLELHDGSSQDHLDILRLAPKLEILRISCVTRRLTVPALVVHTTLHTLEVRGGQLLRNLELPALKTMNLHGRISKRCHPNSLAIVADLLRRSRCSLRELSLYDAVLNAGLIAALQAAPELIRLVIGVSAFTADDDEFLCALVNPESEPNHGLTFNEAIEGPQLLPKLEALQIDALDFTDYLKKNVNFLNTSLVGVVKSRWRPSGSAASRVSCLQSIRVTIGYHAWAGDFTDESVAYLEQLVTEGLDIVIATESASFCSFPVRYIG